MQLVEAGIIDLDEPIVSYLPLFYINPHPIEGGNFQNITTRMILNHTSGLPRDISENFDFGEVTFDGHCDHIVNNFLNYLSDLTMIAEEGSTASYSNVGYVVLGLLIATVSGSENLFYGFIEHMDENIFSPLDLNRSSYIITDELISYLALPYNRRQQSEIGFLNISATGSMISTGNEMAILMHTILNDLNGSEVLLGENYINQMMSFDDLMPFGSMYGLGFIQEINNDGHVIVGHTGSVGYYNSAMLFNLESRFGVFVAGNNTANDSHLTILANQILNRMICEIVDR